MDPFVSATAAMGNNVMSDSMVPLVDAHVDGIMPLGGEGEDDPGFLIIDIVEASGGSASGSKEDPICL